MDAHQIKFPRTAHYYTLNPPTADTKELLMVLHGYGQLASRFIYKFDRLEPSTWVVAPEGFSRFYWKGTSGAVGASWMTKLDRLTEIEDFTNYLQHLYQQCLKAVSTDVRVTILGFSQGGATAVRWLQRLQPEVHRLILWGAGFPQDLTYTPQLNYWNSLCLHCVQGNQDEYDSPELYTKHRAFTQAQGLTYQYHTYEGGHAIDRAVLQEVLDQPF